MTAQTDLEQILCNIGVRVYHTRLSYYLLVGIALQGPQLLYFSSFHNLHYLHSALYITTSQNDLKKLKRKLECNMLSMIYDQNSDVPGPT